MIIKKITDSVYNRDITLIYDASQIEFHEFLEKRHKGLKLDPNFTYAEHLTISSENSWIRHYIRIPKIIFRIQDYGLLIHEIFHCCRECFNEIGMGINEETNEAFAYYQEYIFKQILKALLIKTRVKENNDNKSKQDNQKY